MFNSSFPRFAIDEVIIYIVIGVYWPWRQLATRVAAGAWCCACFFLVQIYCSTLISNLTSPNAKTIIDSFFDIPKTPGVSLVLDRGMGLDVTLKEPTLFLISSMYIKTIFE